MQSTKAKIDTVELETLKDNVNMDELERLKGYDGEDRCISKVRYLKDDRIKIVIHPSRYNSRYDDYGSYSEYKKRGNAIITAIIKNLTLLKLKRLDICVDYTKIYEEQFKLNKALMECVEREKKTSKKYIKCTDEKDNKISSLKWSNDRSLAISIYDKNKESGGRHIYNTRVEYRMFYGNKNYYENVELECIDDLIQLIERFKRPEHYNKAIDKQVGLLEEKVLKMKNFTTMLVANDSVIFDNEIAYKLYEKKGKTRKQAKTLISRVKKGNGIRYIKYKEYKFYLDEQRKKIEKFKDC